PTGADGTAETAGCLPENVDGTIEHSDHAGILRRGKNDHVSSGSHAQSSGDVEQDFPLARSGRRPSVDRKGRQLIDETGRKAREGEQVGNVGRNKVVKLD